jgi:RNA polymerase sigma-70 factor (ECF subfamily)
LREDSLIPSASETPPDTGHTQGGLPQAFADRRAFAVLVATHQDRVRSTCYRFVSNREDADDLAQEVFVQVYESLHHFREEAELSTWIYRIAVNKSLDFLRRQKRKKRIAWLVSFGNEEGGDGVFLPSDNDPHRELEEKELNAILDAALAKLHENQRAVIILSKLEGFPMKEIATIMDLSVSSVESLLHRAKENLRKELARYFKKNLRSAHDSRANDV